MRQQPALAFLADAAAGLAPGLEADAGGLIVRFQHHSEPPGRDVGQRLHLGELDAPVAGHIELVGGAAIALLLVEAHEAVDQHLARQHLHLGIERGAHREAALVELLLGVLVLDVAAHLLGEIFGCEDVRAGRPQRDLERLLLGLLHLLRGDVAVLGHAIEDVVAALEGALALAERMIVVGSFRQRGEISGLRDRQLVHRLVEIEQRGGGDAVGAHAQVYFVEIELEDSLLGEGALDLHRQQGFLDLARPGQLVGEQEVLGDLLGDGGGALRAAAAAVVLDVGYAGARDAREVDAAVLVEALVLGRDEGLDDALRHRLNREIEPPLAGIFGEQRAVGGVHAGHDRRLVVLQLGIVRQVAREVPQQPGRAGDADDEQDGARRKQQTNEAQQQSHRRRPPCRDPHRRQHSPALGPRLAMIEAFCWSRTPSPTPVGSSLPKSLRFMLKLRPIT